VEATGIYIGPVVCDTMDNGTQPITGWQTRHRGSASESRSNDGWRM